MFTILRISAYPFVSVIIMTGIITDSKQTLTLGSVQMLWSRWVTYMYLCDQVPYSSPARLLCLSVSDRISAFNISHSDRIFKWFIFDLWVPNCLINRLVNALSERSNNYRSTAMCEYYSLLFQSYSTRKWTINGVSGENILRNHA